MVDTVQADLKSGPLIMALDCLFHVECSIGGSFPFSSQFRFFLMIECWISLQIIYSGPFDFFFFVTYLHIDKQIPKVKSFETNCAYILYKTNPRVIYPQIPSPKCNLLSPQNGFITLLDASNTLHKRKKITLSHTINQELMFNPLQGQLIEI